MHEVNGIGKWCNMLDDSGRSSYDVINSAKKAKIKRVRSKVDRYNSWAGKV